MTLQDEMRLVDEDNDASIPLPDVTRRSEARRRREQRKRERRGQLLRYAAIGIAAVLALTLLVTLWPDGGPNGNGDNAKDNTAANKNAAAPATTPPVLLAQQDGAGNATSLTLIVPSTKNKGGVLLLIPPGTMAEVPSLGLEPVGKSLGLGGAQRLDGTVENLLGVSIGEVLALDDSRLTALVQPSGPLNVRVPERVERVEPNGTVTVLYEAGLHKVQPQDVPGLLAAKAQSNDLARLARHQAFWDAWLARMRQDKNVIPKDPPGLHKALSALLAGDQDEVTTRALPVTALGASPEDGELYQVNQVELRQLVGTLFPGQSPGGVVRPRLQILNGTGQPGLAQKVADKLGTQGVEVKLTGNAGRLDYTETQIVFYRREDEAVAQRIQQALGAGKLVLSRNPLDVVDITVIVGRDFKAQ